MRLLFLILLSNPLSVYSESRYYLKRMIDAKKEIAVDSSIISKAQVILSCENNKVIDLPAGTTKDSALVSVWDWNGGINQAWKFEKNILGMVIKSEISKKMLTFSSKDSLIIQHDFSDSPYQYWEILPYKQSYRIKNIITGLYLTTDKGNLRLAKLKKEKNQLWQLHNYSEYRKSQTGEKILSPIDMREDIDFFIRNAKSVHPNLFVYTSRSEFNSKVDYLLTKINKPMPVSEFAKLLTPVVNSSFDGHTNVASFSENIEKFKNCSFPFGININNGKIFAIKTCNAKFNNNCPSEIKSINGISYDSIIRYASKFFPYESLKMKEKIIAIYFPLILEEIFNIKTPYKIELFKKKREEITIDCCRDINFNAILTGEKSIPYKFIYNKNLQLGILELNTFSFSQEYEQKFNIFLDSTFNSLKVNKCNRLVIDISRNTGGDSFTAERVLDYISMTQVSYLTHIELKLSKSTKLAYSDNYRKSRVVKRFQKPKNTDDLIAKAILFNRNGSKINYFYRTLKNEHDGFSGKVYLLQSSLTYSAAVDLSYLFYLTGRGKIIGEETGGYTNCYIEGQHFNLPNSNIFGTISRKKCQVSSNFESGGVKPDLYCNIDNDSLSSNLIYNLIKKADTVAIARSKESYNDEFGNYYFIKEKERKICWHEKKYIQAIEVLKAIEKTFSKLQNKYKLCYSSEIQTTYYNMACAYSLLLNGKMSVKYLKKAIDIGYNDYYWISIDSDLEYLRNTHKYKKTLLKSDFSNKP